MSFRARMFGGAAAEAAGWQDGFFHGRVRTDGNAAMHIELSHKQVAQLGLRPGERVYVRPRK